MAGLGGGRKRGQKSQPTELRTYLFDLSWCDTDDHDIVIAAGKHYHKLSRTSPGKLKQLRKAHPVLNHVPDSRATHHIDIDMPANAIQICYLQRFKRGSNDGSWDMLMMFIHHPVRALVGAAKKEHGLLGASEFPKVADKWSRLGLTSQDIAILDDLVGLDTFKDSCDTACTMITGHPEMLCFDDTQSQYIQNTIVSQNSGTLGEFIEFQGPAEPQQSWVDCSTPFTANVSGYATLVPVCNPDTGAQATNSNTGALQYIPSYSDTTNSSLNSDGLQPSLASAKQDTTLGANVTTDPDPTQGLIWRTQDGLTTSVQDDVSLGENTGISYTTKDFSPGHGYSVKITDVDDEPSQSELTAVINIRVKNWYVRYLGLYIRFLDSDGNIITPDDIATEIGDATMEEFFEFPSSFNTSTDVFLDMLSPEFEIFGMPISETDKEFEIPIPLSVSSIVILASGLGATSNNSNPFASTSATGATMTGVVSLGLTTFFLALHAAEGLAPFIESLEKNENALTLIPLIIELFLDVFETLTFNEPSAFAGLGIEIGNKLLSSGASSLVTFVAGFITEAEIEEDVLDTIPIFGLMYSAITAIGTLVQLAETATDVMTSPSTYAFEVTLTHDIPVTVRPNLDDDPSGWPATATHFEVLAHFNDGTPTTVRGELPLTQTTDPQTVTLESVPLGGKVTFSVGVYSDTDYLVGTANLGPEPNDELDSSGEPLAFDITFTELLVPLDASTVYSHEEVIELDADGNHVWVTTTTPPVQQPEGCSPSNGQLCSLGGITVNTSAGAVGQNFQSFNDDVPTCTNPTSFSNGHQFSNISTTRNPESGFFFSGCTFSTSARLVYDLLNRKDNNFYLDTTSRGPGYQGVIRQVRLDKDNNPGFDGPTSNLAWGKLQHPSDSLLLHPGGKIISIANTKNKFEVIELPAAAMSDADAPFSHTYSAKGLRPGLMDGPVLAALDPDGTILVVEAGNKRIQAFDLNGNAAPIFPNGAYFVPLKEQSVSQYLDFTVEFKGYMFVLSIVSSVYTLDIYQPTGEWLAATTGFNAQKIAVNYWRDIFAQNSQVLTLPGGALPARTEPSISHWLPSTP
jgi:hypothetical protein